MSTPDYVVVILYLTGVLAVGLIFARQNRSASDMFAAGGRSPWWASGLSAFMTMFSANTFVVWGGIAYRLGMVAVLINLMYGVAALLVGYFVAGRWKQLGVETPAEFIKLRYGATALHFFTWFMTTFKMLTTAGALYAMGRILVTLVPLPEGHFLQDPETGNLSLGLAIVFLSGVVVVYTMIGGLWAVLMTDVLQFIVLNLAVLFVIPLMIAEVGGPVAAIRGLSTVAVDSADHSMLSPLSGDYTLLFLAGWCAIHFFMIGAEWAFVQRFICVPDASSARKCAYLFGVLYLVSPLLWLMPPMLYRLIDGASPGLTAELFEYIPATHQAGLPAETLAAIRSGDAATLAPGAVEELRQSALRFKSETAYISACERVLPVGMMGLVFASMFSATASMVSSQLNVFSGVLTNDIYKPFARSMSPAGLMWAGRAITVLLGVLLIGIALSYESLGGAERVIIMSTEAIVVALLAPTLWGLFSRRVNVSAVWWTAGVGMAAGLLVRFGLIPGGFLAGMEAIEPAADWVQANMKLAETISGVALPLVVLGVAQMTSQGTSVGYERVCQSTENAAAIAPDAVATVNRLPAIVVGWSLAVCGVLMIGLVLVNDQSRWLLAGFGVILLAMAGLILWGSYQRDPPSSPGVKHA